MKAIFRFIILGALTLACTSESDVGPASGSTFVRYLGSEHNNVAVLAQEIPDGFALLSYSEIAGTTVGEVNYQVKFTLLDKAGNWRDERNYPETPGDPNQRFHIKASSFIPVSSGGYLIIGEGMNVNENQTTKVQLIRIDDTGNLIAFNTIADPSPTVSLHGSAVIEDNGDFVVLAKVTGDPTNDMMVARIAGNALSVDRPTTNLSAGVDGILWTRKYGAGLSTLISRIDQNLEANNDFFWGGSVQNSTFQKNDIRMIRMLANSEVPPGGRPIGDSDPAVDEVALDFCRSFSGYAMTGSRATTAAESNLNGDIYVVRLNTNSDVIFKTQLAPFDAGDLKDEGVSIDQTENHDLVVLANVGTSAKQQDLLVVKLDATGKEIWRHNYGSSEKQEAASIRHMSDGLLVFATTYFGNVKKLMLLKLNEDGQL